MMGMASPTGYLDLIQPAIDAAARTGTGNVDGVPVTNYLVANDLDQLASAAGTTGAEAQTINTALAPLKAQGFTTDRVLVSVDGSGYIRQVKATDTFGDGGKVTLESTFSNFGCAGTVLMPGQTGSGVPPTGCTSPDGTGPAAATGESRSANIESPTTVGLGPATSTTVTPIESTTSTVSPPTTVQGPSACHPLTLQPPRSAATTFPEAGRPRPSTRPVDEHLEVDREGRTGVEGSCQAGPPPHRLGPGDGAHPARNTRSPRRGAGGRRPPGTYSNPLSPLDTPDSDVVRLG